jgi:hypothetical protein
LSRKPPLKNPGTAGGIEIRAAIRRADEMQIIELGFEAEHRAIGLPVIAELRAAGEADGIYPLRAGRIDRRDISRMKQIDVERGRGGRIVRSPSGADIHAAVESGPVIGLRWRRFRSRLDGTHSGWLGVGEIVVGLRDMPSLQNNNEYRHGDAAYANTRYTCPTHCQTTRPTRTSIAQAGLHPPHPARESRIRPICPLFCDAVAQRAQRWIQ